MATCHKEKKKKKDSGFSVPCPYILPIAFGERNDIFGLHKKRGGTT